mmetsp:Transcript_42546/g.49693  ORF Transcript_42546/g.49693 Transcript_42546/m.49693 type:complete len:84 (-) Transcript_42546:291-542(-)
MLIPTQVMYAVIDMLEMTVLAPSSLIPMIPESIAKISNVLPSIKLINIEGTLKDKNNHQPLNESLLMKCIDDCSIWLLNNSLK